MFEIFLFVNPIGLYCYDTEILIKEAIDELNLSSCFHFIPIINTKVIREDITRRKKDGQKVTDIPLYTMAACHALRNYHAIKFEYGNKKARSYLINLQNALSHNLSHYSEKLPRTIMKNLGLDYKRVCDPRLSSYIDDSIRQDKKLALNYNVRNIPSTIIFNESGNYNGILLEGIVAHDNLISLLKHDSCCAKEDSYYPTNHLHLM